MEPFTVRLAGDPLAQHYQKVYLSWERRLRLQLGVLHTAVPAI